MQTDVLIIGGGFAGVTVAVELQKQGIHTILVDKKDYFEVTFATLRNIADPQKTGNQPRKLYRDFIKGDFVQGSVVNMDNDHVELTSGEAIYFKQAVIASGTRYPTMTEAKSNNALDIVSRNAEMLAAHRRLKQAKRVMVIGGGVVGVELAGEIASAMPGIQLTLAHGGTRLLDGFKSKAQKKARQQLEKIGVKLEFNRRFSKVDGRYIDRNTGDVSDAELVFEATGVLPNNEFLQANLPDILNERGYIQVNARLQVEGHQNLYALGDIADIGEAKLGYLAQQQGVHLAKLIAVQSEKGKQGKAYKRNPLMALIPVGQKQGVVQLPFAVTTLNMLVNMKQKDLFINKVYNAFGTRPNPQ